MVCRHGNSWLRLPLLGAVQQISLESVLKDGRRATLDAHMNNNEQSVRNEYYKPRADDNGRNYQRPIAFAVLVVIS
jgi:hypothetical protein